MYANARSVFDHARSDLDEALTYRCELSLGQRTGLRNGGAHAMHEPERRGVEVMLISEVMPIAGWDSGQHWGQQIDGFAMPPHQARADAGQGSRRDGSRSRCQYSSVRARKPVLYGSSCCWFRAERIMVRQSLARDFGRSRKCRPFRGLAAESLVPGEDFNPPAPALRLGPRANLGRDRGVPALHPHPSPVAGLRCLSYRRN